MSAPQLTDANTSSEWFRTVKDQGAGPQRSPSQVAIDDGKQRRQRFVRLVTYTMAGLVAFTLLGVASFAWRQHSMKAALEAVPVAAAPAPQPATPAPAPVAEAQTETVPAPPVAAAVPPPPVKRSAAARSIAKSRPALKTPARTSPSLSAKKPPAKTR